MNILIPAYKPDERLLELVHRLHDETEYNLIVVNDGSGSEFDAVFTALPSYVTLLSHAVNQGKGRAMKTGFSYILENLPDSQGVIIVDADGQHLLKDINRVYQGFLEHPDSIIIGSRKFTGEVPLRSRFGNSLTRHVFALASGVKLMDTQTGLRAIPIQYLREFIDLKGERYEYEMNMLLQAAELGIPMHEVFIETVYIDDNSSSHFHVIRDSLKIYAVIFKFIMSSLIGFLVDYVLFNLLYALLGGMSNAALQMLVSTVGARAVSSFVNYMVNKKVVFKSRDGMASTLVKYYTLVVVILAANYGLMLLLCNVLGMAAPLAKILVEVVLFVVNYLVQRTFVFKNKRAAA
ncbi:bifunctional glycosyltransferase family 2/GtrA family protein [Guopingia tenuis]|uniref:bifunctional glycosyltransferase family 2/GtrA family protein n=1 Tax=Guopingia tenuis TaxID=2763656 RepID=UPI0024B58910|nr:bifunctional glycosyltransferase family 2/GtrA family protein [Guopingia tenuis]